MRLAAIIREMVESACTKERDGKKDWFIVRQDANTVELRDVPCPRPGGELLVRPAAGLNRGEFIDGHGLAGSAAKRPASNRGRRSRSQGVKAASRRRVMGRSALRFLSSPVSRDDAMKAPAKLDG